MELSTKLANATTGQLMVELTRRALKRSALIDRIVALDVDARTKLALISCTTTSDNSKPVEDLISGMEDGESGAKKRSEAIRGIVAAIEWSAIEAAINRQFNLGTQNRPESTDAPVKTKQGQRVYFIASKKSGLVKIGKSIDPEARFASIQTMSPDELSLLGSFPEGDITESSLHQKFSHLRRHGEWFEFGDEIRKFIQALDLTNA